MKVYRRRGIRTNKLNNVFCEYMYICNLNKSISLHKTIYVYIYNHYERYEYVFHEKSLNFIAIDVNCNQMWMPYIQHCSIDRREIWYK